MSEDAKIRLGCLEIGASLARAQNNYSEKSVVEIASVLYNFTKSPTLEEISTEKADKPRPRKAAGKTVDILS